MVRPIAVGLGQDSLYVMINQYKWTQLLLLGYSLAGANFWHLEGILHQSDTHGLGKHTLSLKL